MNSISVEDLENGLRKNKYKHSLIPSSIYYDGDKIWEIGDTLYLGEYWKVSRKHMIFDKK